MVDRFGPRGVFAVLIPQQNANMQPEYEAMRPDGVSNQIYRFDLSAPDHVPEAVLAALPAAQGCWPDMIICGNSLEMRYWSVARQVRYREQIAEVTNGVAFVTATDACEAALRTLGVRRIAAISPMQAAHSRSVQAYYEALGFEVPYATSLMVERPADIIKVAPERVFAAFDEIDHDDVDTLLHVGGALGTVAMIEALEARYAKPVVAVNAATYWYALRRHGITDAMPGFGQPLMREAVEQ